MSRTPTRTDQVEALDAEEARLVSLSVDARTAARAFRNVGDAIAALPSEGPFHEFAKSELSTLAHSKARECADQSDKLDNKARAISLKKFEL